MSDALVLGAVASDASVVTIWDGFQRWFARELFELDYVLFSSYERLVEAQLRGVVHVAWNSPLAWLECLRLAARHRRSARPIAMRDADQDLSSVFLVRADSDLRSVDALRGRRIAVGAPDSPQATLLPLLHLAERGLEPHVDFEVVVHDTRSGRHGERPEGERDALRALVAGKVDAACVLDAHALGFVRDGTVHEGALRMVAETAPYDRKVMTALNGGDEPRLRRFVELLLSMRPEDPEAAPFMELEHVKEWRPGRFEGYRSLACALDRFHTIEAWLDRVAPRSA